jgi:CheY-like chemotaxis protein
MSESEEKYAICIVDDDAFLLDMYSLKFQQAGHTITCCVNGTVALDTLKKGDVFDAILLDLVMPQVDGYAVLKAIREENLVSEHTAIIILSNQGQEKDIERAQEYGVDGYLVKANTLPSEVLDKVEKMIAEKRSGMGE